jgi:signal transduction histidine kinase
MRAFARVLGEPETLQRRYAIASLCLAVLVIGIILLFGHLISRSLSKRYVEDLILSGQIEGQKLADELGAGQGNLDLYELTEKRQEQIIRTLSGVPQLLVWESVQVRDRYGRVVLNSTLTMTEDLPEPLASQMEIKADLGDRDVRETENSYEISVPLGEIGEMVVNISKARLAERALVLRRELLQKTYSIAGVTSATLVGALVLVWHLIQRTRKLEEQRREAQEMAALGGLAANLAHEIRNPLNSINLNLEMLEEDLPSSSRSESDATLDNARREVRRLANLVSDFLSYARPAEPKFDSVQISPLVRDAVEFLRAEARTMGAHFRLPPGFPAVVVKGDSGQLRQVLLNLLLNAVQAVSDLSHERRVIEVAIEGGDEEVAIVIRDRGNGIPEADLRQVRDAFFSSRPGGSGLGLAIAERIVRNHGGRISLTNLAPMGFEAVIVLPLQHDNGNMERL